MQTLGFNHYALTSHLGNVLSVVTDNINISPDSAFAKIVAATDYYAFGSEIPGRTYSGGGQEGYRYGFNGKEKDTENTWGDTNYDYGFRIYNPRYGRFLSVDPIAQSYPWYTPYQFAGNKPIANIDIDGLEDWYNANGTKSELHGPRSSKSQEQLKLFSSRELILVQQKNVHNVIIAGKTGNYAKNQTPITDPNSIVDLSQNVLSVGSGFLSSGSSVALQMDQRYWIDNSGLIRSRMAMPGKTRAFSGNIHTGFSKNSKQLFQLADGIGDISTGVDLFSTAIDGIQVVDRAMTIEGNLVKKLNTSESGSFLMNSSLSIGSRYFPITSAFNAIYVLTTTNPEFEINMRRSSYNEYLRYSSEEHYDPEKAQKFLDNYIKYGGELPKTPTIIKAKE
jgi:RHS repeat-associated protein